MVVFVEKGTNGSCLSLKLGKLFLLLYYFYIGRSQSKKGNRLKSAVSSRSSLARKNSAQIRQEIWQRELDLSLFRGLDEDTISRQKIADVKVVDLFRFREFQRDLDLENTPYHRDLAEHIKKHGVVNPIILVYNPDTGVAFVSEGNHRLEIARLVGIEKVPVRIAIDPRKDPSPDGLGGGAPEISSTLSSNGPDEIISAKELGFDTQKTQPIEPHFDFEEIKKSHKRWVSERLEALREAV